MKTRTKIVTNNRPRPVLYWHELTLKEQKEFDWIENPENMVSFFRYRGQVYCLNEVMKVEQSGELAVRGWHGHIGESFFSSIVVRLSDDGETLVVGLALS